MPPFLNRFAEYLLLQARSSITNIPFFKNLKNEFKIYRLYYKRLTI